MTRALLVVTAILTQVAVAEGQPRVVVIDRGPGASGGILAEVLASPHRLVEPDTQWFVVQRTTLLRENLVVLGRTTAVEGQIDGDVVVVGGDLFVRPGARIRGRAVAIGGGVYPSALAVLEGDSRSFRDNTFDIRAAPSGYELTYRSLYADASPPLLFPGIYGVRLPTYDRVNGVSVPFGPTLSFAGGRGAAHFLVTYRSDIGKIDPTIGASLQLTRRLRAEARAERGTFSNDEWIWSDLVNSLSVLSFGKDTRNYYRADRGELSVHRLWETSTLNLEPFLGALIERSWAIGPGPGELGAPWSVFNRTDTLEGMRRLNPPVPALDLVSAIFGTSALWEAGGVRMRARASGERALHLDARAADAEGEHFLQFTSDVAVDFLTFGEQEYALDVHWVTTPAGAAPPQRFAYLGGSGTLPFLDLLEQGGDEVLLVDQRYSIPLLNVRLGLLGSPTLQLRHRLGSAGLERLPTFEQVLGLGVHLTIIRVELQLDPATGDTRFSLGFTFSR